MGNAVLERKEVEKDGGKSITQVLWEMEELKTRLAILEGRETPEVPQVVSEEIECPPDWKEKADVLYPKHKQAEDVLKELFALGPFNKAVFASLVDRTVAASAVVEDRPGRQPDIDTGVKVESLGTQIGNLRRGKWVEFLTKPKEVKYEKAKGEEVKVNTRVFKPGLCLSISEDNFIDEIILVAKHLILVRKMQAERKVQE